MKYIKIFKHIFCLIMTMAFLLNAYLALNENQMFLSGLCFLIAAQFAWHALGWQNHYHKDDLPCKQGEDCETQKYIVIHHKDK